MQSQQASKAGFFQTYPGPLKKGEPTPEGQALFESDHLPDPVHSMDKNNKPIFDASFPQHFVPNDREMSDKEKLAWKTFQMYRLTLKVDRRDTVYEAYASSDYPYFRPTQHWMGAPFAVIEPHPFIGEVLLGMRWYEHLCSAAASFLYFQWIRSKPTIKYSGSVWFVQKYIMVFVFTMMEFNFGYRSIWRLQGQVPNEPECYKYGVCETPERLRQKEKYWSRFKAYKDEWCKRWDYYMWGMRPGERYTFFSACWMPPWPVRYNTKFDYPIRKNPFTFTEKALRDMRLESNMSYVYEKNNDSYLERQRPELKYIWRGGVG